MPDTTTAEQPQPAQPTWGRTREQCLTDLDARLDELVEIADCVRVAVAIVRDGAPCRKEVAAAARARLARLHARLGTDQEGAELVADIDARSPGLLTPAQRASVISRLRADCADVARLAGLLDAALALAAAGKPFADLLPGLREALRAQSNALQEVLSFTTRLAEQN